jgi:hypothetical protein
MGLEWVLLSLLTAVALWLGMDACRESKRLHARLSRVELQRPTDRELSNTGDWAYWPLTTSAEDTRIGPRF